MSMTDAILSRLLRRGGMDKAAVEELVARLGSGGSLLDLNLDGGYNGGDFGVQLSGLCTFTAGESEVYIPFDQGLSLDSYDGTTDPIDNEYMLYDGDALTLKHGGWYWCLIRVSFDVRPAVQAYLELQTRSILPIDVPLPAGTRGLSLIVPQFFATDNAVVFSNDPDDPRGIAVDASLASVDFTVDGGSTALTFVPMGNPSWYPPAA